MSSLSVLKTVGYKQDFSSLALAKLLKILFCCIPQVLPIGTFNPEHIL